MSAFVLSNAHLLALLNFAASYDQAPRLPAFYLAGGRTLATTSAADLQTAAEILLAQNVASVNYRYRESAPAPAIVFNYSSRPTDPVQILKACACYDYQAGETPDYSQTDAAAIVDRIRRAAIAALPGYDAADWEIR